MDKTLLNKLKIKVTGLANATITWVEVVAEEQKLKSKYQSLGKKIYVAIQDDLLDTMKDDPSMVELLGCIEEIQKKIKELKGRLKGKTADSEKT